MSVCVCGQTDGDHLGPFCIVCGTCTDLAQTCLTCVGRVRADLAAIVTEYARLPAELTERGGTSLDPIPKGSRETAMPGGDALVMLAGGVPEFVQRRHYGPHWQDENPNDPPSIVNLLMTEEDDWRVTLGMPAAMGGSVTSCAAFLAEHNGEMAQRHPAYDEYAAAIRKTRSRLETYLRDDHRPVTKDGGVCLDCDANLVRKWRNPAPCQHAKHLTPRRKGDRWETVAEYQQRLAEHEAAHMRCDQGGLSDDWTCPRCGRIYGKATDSDNLAQAQARMKEARSA